MDIAGEVQCGYSWRGTVMRKRTVRHEFDLYDHCAIDTVCV